jgi:hypothetical protein
VAAPASPALFLLPLDLRQRIGSSCPPNRSEKPHCVRTLGTSADADYNQQQMQDLITKVDELIYALRR